MSLKLFISYAHVDRFMVNQLVEIFRNAGLDAWFDHRLAVGSDWKEELLKAIVACDVFVYTLSPESVASEWCQWEFARAIELQKPIIPILIQSNTQIPDPLKKYQYADFTMGPTNEGIARLMGGLWSVRVVLPAQTAQTVKIDQPNGIPAQAASPATPAPVNTTKALNTLVLNGLRYLESKRGGYQFGAILTRTHSANGLETLLGFIDCEGLDDAVLTELMLRDWQQIPFVVKGIYTNDITSGTCLARRWDFALLNQEQVEKITFDFVEANQIMGSMLTASRIRPIINSPRDRVGLRQISDYIWNYLSETLN